MRTRDPLEQTHHRLETLPDRSWVMAQVWHDLLFAHWDVDPEVVAPTLPDGLELDTRDGRAWIGVVPFRMSGVRLRGLPAVPGTGAFPELNVRTYVRCGGRAGVWFYSLDAANRLAVRVARTWFHLPYFDARMSCAKEGEGIRYESTRTHRGATPGRFVGRYGPDGDEARSRAGSLEHFLTERYCLFAAKPDGRILRGEIHHPPWPLQPARADLAEETVSRAAGFELAGEPLLHFARRVDVRCWSPVVV